jgi:hypothetical protein
MREQRKTKLGRQAALLATLLSATLITGQLIFPESTISAAKLAAPLHIGDTTIALPDFRQPVQALVKLLAAFFVGMVLSLVHRLTHRGEPFSRSMQHAQVLLCVSGALMMMIIGDSLARAFGIAGAVSIVRFRTPVEDPKDSMILFLSLGLGMAAGLGAFALAGAGTLFLCLVLFVLERFHHPQARSMMLSLAAEGPTFPSVHVQRVLEQNAIGYETREVCQGPEAGMKYRVQLWDDQSLEALSAQLRDGGSGIRSVIWEKSKRDR